ncbi:MAG: hypothetical protein EOM24_04025 [Chloroflexia bacterium]|nr:hypothetical protein [Chloroflexia bacterium]
MQSQLGNLPGVRRRDPWGNGAVSRRTPGMFGGLAIARTGTPSTEQVKPLKGFHLLGPLDARVRGHAMGITRV